MKVCWPPLALPLSAEMCRKTVLPAGADCETGLEMQRERELFLKAC